MSSGGTVRPRVVQVTRASEYDGLLARHGTREQARFYLAGRGESLEEVDRRHRELQDALRSVRRAIPASWRFSRLDRADLASFVFEPGDLVLVVGQDGLVANVAKYLDGQLVAGINPSPDRYPGVLVRHRPSTVAPILRAWQAERLDSEQRPMVEAALDDGQRLAALNEIFVGHRTHQSARYRIELGDRVEDHSSSGLIVATGTGATGWALSIARERRAPITLPAPTEARAAFLVREPWPSRATGTSVDGGILEAGERLVVTSQMNDGGSIFGDGVESDRLDFAWGRTVKIGLASATLRLVIGL